MRFQSFLDSGIWSDIPINVSVNIPFLNFLIGLNFNHKFQAWALIGRLRGCGQVQRMC